MWSNRQELHDAEAERARQHLPEPTMPWRAPGARVVAVGGLPGDRVGGAVSVGSLQCRNKTSPRRRVAGGTAAVP